MRVHTMFYQSQKRECPFSTRDTSPFQCLHLLIARRTINNKTNSSSGPLTDGDGSVGDPASKPVSVCAEVCGVYLGGYHRSRTGGAFAQLDTSRPQRYAIFACCGTTTRVSSEPGAALRIGCHLPQGGRGRSLVRPPLSFEPSSF